MFNEKGREACSFVKELEEEGIWGRAEVGVGNETGRNGRRENCYRDIMFEKRVKKKIKKKNC